MKTVFILFDSLNRDALSCYNANAIATPNFDRLASKGVTFDKHFIGSLPCMPARRDLLTGKLNFLHRSWGPVEPFDTCFPSLLQSQGVYTHLISDHYHYWEAGGCGYHNQYSSAEFVRGQERDLWKAMVQPPVERFREQYHSMLVDVDRRQPNMINREYIKEESDFPVVRCIDLANEFLQQNSTADDWFLQVELFDPHEPFTAPKRYRENLPTSYTGPVLDWPLYKQLDLSSTEITELQANYQATVAMCDYHLGRLLDQFDQLDLWKNTAIVLTTDHGFMLGERDWWGKNVMPVYDPIARIPLIIYHPDCQSAAGQRRSELTQCLDVSASLVALHRPESGSGYTFREGYSLLPALSSPQTIRTSALFGIFGGALNITDGEHTYFRYPVDTSDNLFEYTLMPVHPASYFNREEFDDIKLIDNYPFADGYPILRLKALDNARRPPMQGGALKDAESVIYTVESDSNQQIPLENEVIEQQMMSLLAEAMKANNAPEELYTRFGIQDLATSD